MMKIDEKCEWKTCESCSDIRCSRNRLHFMLIHGTCCFFCSFPLLQSMQPIFHLRNVQNVMTHPAEEHFMSSFSCLDEISTHFGLKRTFYRFTGTRRFYFTNK